MDEIDTINAIELFFRSSGISLFLLLMALMIRDSASPLARWLGAWAALSGAAYLVCTSPVFNALFGTGMVVVQQFCHSGQIAIWLFSVSQFQDKMRLWPHYILISIGFFLLGRVYFGGFFHEDSVWSTLFGTLNAAARFGLLVHMIYVAWEGRDDDLIEARRRFRLIYIVGVTVTVMTVVVVETWFEREQLQGQTVLLLQSFGMWLLAAVLVWQSINLHTAAIFTGTKPIIAETKPLSNDPGERHDLATIQRLVTEDRLFLNPGMTIANLAAAAGLPEHRLRRLINRHLGYRNFADFLNHYRIKAAKDRLSSIQERNIPVLTIAMDLGYGSLGPFNRAFKERTGLTPTEYRRKKLADS